MIKIRPNKLKKSYSPGQTAVEYMLLLTTVAAIVLIAFKTYLPRTHIAANFYYNRVAVGILGDPNPCGDGVCGQFETTESCCADCPGGGSCGIFNP